MSFCFLLNAVVLFAGVVTFIIAGFAGTFSRRLHGLRYRIMLAPLGFVVLGSISYSATSRLAAWFTQANPGLHLAHNSIGTGSDIFISAILLLAGSAGVMVGIALGAAFDRAPSADQTYTIANYWNRPSTLTSGRAAEARPHRAKVISMSDRHAQTGTVPHGRSASTAISENE